MEIKKTGFWNQTENNHWLGLISVCSMAVCPPASPAHACGLWGDMSILVEATQAFQMVVEEQLLHDIEANALYIVGMEGFWGFIVTSLFCMPLAQALPGVDGQGVHEDIALLAHFCLTKLCL